MWGYGNDLDLGPRADGAGRVVLPANRRDEHLYAVGSSGKGKSRFLQHIIRQDIANWHRGGQCGLLLIDPHGSLYDGIMAWMAACQLERPVVSIDLRDRRWIVSYDLLRKRPNVPQEVVVGNLVDEVAYVWGQSDTDHTPLFARWAANVFHTLYELDFTLAEATYMTGTGDERRLLTDHVQRHQVARDWAFANKMREAEFQREVGSTVNRMRRLLDCSVLKTMFGQQERPVDLKAAIEEGWIILVRGGIDGGVIRKEDCHTFAALLLADLWTAAQERGKPPGGKKPKPFYVYLDEFQRFLSPTIAENFDEARGFGLCMTIAHQFPAQLAGMGQVGERILDSILENAGSKVCFGLRTPKSLKPMAEALFMNVLDPDKIKDELYSTKVMDYRLEYQKAYAEAASEGEGTAFSESAYAGAGSADVSGLSRDIPMAFGIPGFPQTLHTSTARSGSSYQGHVEAESRTRFQGTSKGTSEFPMLMPVLGQELSSRQFESIEEQLWRCMAVLHDQDQRHGVARVATSRLPEPFVTPFVDVPAIPEEAVRSYVDSIMEKLPCALPTEQAAERLAARERAIQQRLLGYEENTTREPTTARWELPDVVE